MKRPIFSRSGTTAHTCLMTLTGRFQPNVIIKRHFFTFLYLAILGIFVISMPAGAQKMNVLFIVADDLNNEVGCYGSERGITPHLDRLAEMGMRFDNAYAQYPVCNPSRNSFLSGMRPDETGLPKKWESLRSLVPEVTTLPQLFRENGYYTASVGKVFHIDGWDKRWPDAGWVLGDSLSWDFRINCPPAEQGERRMPPFPRKGIRVDFPGFSGPIDYGMISFESDLAQDDGQATQEAIRQLDLPKDKPFFLAVGYRRPHAPFIAPEKYFFPYPLNTMHIPDPGDRSDVTDLAFTVHPANYGDPEAMKKMKMCYMASISFLDSQVGRLLQSLEDHGLMDNTIIVFFSDHGFHLGEHGQWHKFTLYEESARVPLMIRVPGKTTSGSVTSEIVELVDLFPTLQELCGLPATNQQLAGQSLVSLLEDPSRAADTGPAITQVRRNRGEDSPVMGYSIRTENYRYNEWWTEAGSPELVASELYDLEKDPEEEINRAGNPAYDSVREELSRLLSDYRKHD